MQPEPPTAESRSRPRRIAGLRRWQLLLLVYLALLAVTHLLARDGRAPLRSNQRILELPAVEGDDQATASTVELAWAQWGSPASETVPVLFLHGSPGSHVEFRRVAPRLGEERWVLAPDLPGFGASSRRVPDYSIRAHAHYALKLLDHLGVERAHLVGFSLGGGVALNLYDLAPERVASVSLLSSVGVQELELLGDYRLNHLIHGLQVGVLWLLHEAVPHMGVLDRFPLNVAYARNFFDTDQRPLREMLERFEPPMLIVHGERDPLVPAGAAVEHHRLVPQSELHMLASDHFYLFRRGDAFAALLDGFVERVEAGEATVRFAADPERVVAAQEPFDPSRIPLWTGPALLVVMLLLAVATLVSEDLTCIGAGLLVAQGRLAFIPAAVACFLGIYVGDLLLFWAGRLLGRPVLGLAPFRWWLKEEAVEESSAWFRRRGAVVIVLSRFLPGTRLPTYFAAGLLRTGFWHFAGYFFVAAVVWTPALVGLAAWVGAGAFERLEWLQKRAWLLLLLLFVVATLIRKLLLPLFHSRGRRRLVGRCRRLVHWEFWPPWVFYPPLILYILYLGLRYRGLSLFTAANPGIPAGGFVGESKADILRRLEGLEEWLPRWHLVSGAGSLEEKLVAVERFRRAHDLGYPLILKPDAGQRGSGVAVVRSDSQVEEYFRRTTVPTLVQEYAPGLEFGVFYYRFPSEKTGRIFSITEKRWPMVVGDGTSTVEELILRDERAVCMADVYFGQLGDARRRVPASREEVQLAEVGAHARGTIFLDGSHLKTPELEETVDRLSHTFDGFYFGRYDFRVASVEDFQRGGPFKIIELNGVTSEATHIYDRRNRLWQAYRILARQWRIAFEIGADRRAAGVRPTPLRELLKEALRYRKGARFHPTLAVCKHRGPM